MFENTKKLLKISRELGVPSTDCIIFHQGKEVFRETVGTFDDTGKPITGKERYNLYSCSKPITCTAALQLFENGKFSLKDELAEYMPEFGDMKVVKNGAVVKAEKKILVENLFEMTAGLGYDTNGEEIQAAKRDTEGKCPTRETMKYLAKRPLWFEPGESWNYSFCHDVLAAFVEVVSGKRFGLYVKENIFDPLGMKNATFLLPEGEENDIPDQYQYNDQTKSFVNSGKKILWYKLGSEYESGGAGGIASLEEYAKFAEGLRSGKLLSGETLDLMQTDRLNEQTRKAYWGSNGYGYGLGVRCPTAAKLRTDIGWDGAAGAFLAVDRQNGISVCYCQHVLNTPNRNLRKDFIEAAKLDLGYPAFEEDMWQGEASSLA